MSDKDGQRPLTVLVRGSAPSLTNADQRLINVMMADPATAQFLSGAELAARAEVHEAAATRLAKKLGFKGYPQLRDSLRDEVRANSEPAGRMSRKLDAVEGDSLIRDLVRREVATLDALAGQLDQERLDNAADRLIAARRIFLYGRGHATSIVALLDRRLRRFGLQIVTLPTNGRDLAEHVLGMQAGDVVLGLALHRRPKGLGRLCQYAAELGAGSIVIADTVGPRLKPEPDQLLWASRGPDDEFQTLTVPMAICNALVLTIAKRNRARSMEALDRLGTLIDAFE